MTELERLIIENQKLEWKYKKLLSICEEICDCNVTYYTNIKAVLKEMKEL